MAQVGGKRPGAGRKPGSKNKLTVENRATLKELAIGLVPLALQALEDIARNGQSETARISAATTILDRAYGKAWTAEPPPPEGADAKPVAPVFEVAEPVRDVRVTRASDA